MPTAGSDGPAGVGIGPQLRGPAGRAEEHGRGGRAERADQGFVSKLERDLASVSVASLIRLCTALDISAGSLLQPPPGEVIRHDAYPPINFGGSGVREYLLTPSGEKRMQAILSDIEPGGGSGAVTFAGSTGHTFQVPPGTGPTRVLWVFSPALPDTPSWPD
jgi:transcriptional regulator with XRE-family HTH domain